MGLVRTPLTLSNPKEPNLAPMVVDALVDSGSLHLCIPRHVALQLRLEVFDEREVTVADGSRHLRPYVGPIALACANRRCLGGAMVLGDEVLLGAIPMEDMDLTIHPATLRVGPNPSSPNIASSVAMGVRYR